MGTSVYVDGFNLYYGAARGTPFKWLDLEAVTTRLQPHDAIGQIRYFTARLKPTPGSPDTPKRQDIYLRALRSNPKVEIHFGHFRADPTWRPLAAGPWRDVTRPRLRPGAVVGLVQRLIEPHLDRPPVVRILKMEEKGSDVNLAAHLLNDVLVHGVTKALVISNDADLAEPVRLAVDHGATVGVVNPHGQNPVSRHLRKVASFTLPLRSSILASCQLPPTVVDQRGRQIHKPRDW